MKTRTRFSKERVTRAFDRGFRAKRMKKPTIAINNKPTSTIGIDEESLLDGMLVESDLDALDEMVREMDAAVAEIMAKRKKKEKDGEDCVKCGTFYPQAEPNQPNGTLICYSCRNFG